MSRPPIGRRAAVEMVDLHLLQSIAPDAQPIGFHGLITNPRSLAPGGNSDLRSFEGALA
jgi:hypothetical protein